MQQFLPAIFFGFTMIVIGSAFMFSHVQAIRKHLAEDGVDDQDRTFFERQYRRRMQTSGMIVLMGVLIPAFDIVLVMWKNPWLSSIALIVILLIPVWIVFMALGDMFSNNGYRMRTKAKLEEIRYKQNQLEQHAEQLRQQTNGSTNS